MSLHTKNQKKGETNQPEKLYTQLEVDDLLEQKRDSLPSQARQIKEEGQAANKQQRLENETVADLVKKSNRILVSISSHAFPFDPFPNTINVEDTRVTIINRHLFSSEIHSVDIRNISNIFINRTFLFSQLAIISETYEENEIRVGNLRTEEAIFVRRIIEGLRMLEDKQIDTSSYTKEELIDKLEELSTTEIVT